MARPRVLITGITGMVGSHLADFLLEKTDWDIIGMSRWRSPMDNLEHLTHRINSGDRMFLQYESGGVLGPQQAGGARRVLAAPTTTGATQ